ncbi:ABC transporter substrate-binding protein [Microvirga sp. BT689]|uniref:ABC transporter substrate-binding protein n=1 Tax=Microvirga arvi TaxID=2778731 RepID=UPI00194E0610|nr:ABC transporter substrate-binding protein [Microvirga arvi]MBM6583732.1 ABC transporter substrate-binding protein [Microvirga arvi]
MGRHTALATLLITLLISTAEAQTPTKTARIGKLCPAKCDGLAHITFDDEIRKLGWVEGRDLTIERKEAEGRFERLPDLAAQLVRSRPDVIVASSTRPVQAVKNATSEIPIVFAAVGDPVGTGLVQSLARPGGNVTGVTYFVPGFGLAKKFEIIRELLPQAQHVGVLASADNDATRQRLSIEIPIASQRYGFRIDVIGFRVAEDIDGAVAKAKMLGVEALAVAADPIVNTPWNRVPDLVAQAGIPAVYDQRDSAQAGGLIAYGIDIAENARTQARLVDRVLRGASPAKMPVEQPTRYIFIVNLKTAKALGLTVPPSLLSQADEVIE